ncbi:unnamed protein product [Cunninghamella blakesleeana]
MDDFDITNFRDHPSKAIKNEDESSYASYLKKRKLLGLDDSDSNSDSNDEDNCKNPK